MGAVTVERSPRKEMMDLMKDINADLLVMIVGVCGSSMGVAERGVRLGRLRSSRARSKGNATRIYCQ